MRIAVACDHAGFPLKADVVGFLQQQGHEVVDRGTWSTASVDYPDAASAAAAAILGGQAERAVVLCGSGIGASVAANKVAGIRAGVCHDTYSAHQCVEHDDVNVLCLGGRVIGSALMEEILVAFINARFSGEERHRRRLAKIQQLESTQAPTVERVPMSQSNPLKQLHDYGQSFWWDTLSRRDIEDGVIARLRDEDGMRGMTSNPSIFKAAIADSSDYDGEIQRLTSSGMEARDVFWDLAIRDIRDACDLIRPVYDSSEGEDGYVSLEVNPHLAFDTKSTCDQVEELWQRVDRPNLMVKIPGTPEGLPAIRESLVAGRNINVTLLFSQQAHEDVMEAYLAALEQRLEKGLPLDTVSSVASFFVSRVDSLIDKKLDALGTPEAAALRGRAGIANARLAYRNFERVFSGPRWERLAKAGARVQRPLWASTSVKDPNYPDVMYVEALIGPHTVNTMPTVTVDAYRDHGAPSAARVKEGVDGAAADLAALEKLGISMDQVTEQLLQEGVSKFEQAFDQLLGALASKVEAIG